MMNSYPGKNTKRLWLLLLCGILVSACGGGAGDDGTSQSAGIGGTGINTAKGVVVGKVTDFGSIYVNGLKFNTDSSSFIVDGDTGASQNDLAVGMVVKLEVETENGGYTGKALQVVYDDEIEGPIASVTPNASMTTKTVEVFGQKIVVSDTSTLFKGAGFSFANINVDDVIEVSGFRVASDKINATFVRKTGVLDLGVTEVELRGNINNLSSGPPPIFKIGGVTITTGGFTQFEVPGGVLSEDLYVEVKGVIETATSVRALEIEYEDEDFGDDVDDVSLQGVISDFTDIDSPFKINGQAVDASQASLEPANAATLLDDGVTVEVEGNIVGGVLQAEELELEDGNAELRSFVGMVDSANGWFMVTYPTTALGSIMVRIDAQTVFEDEAGASPLQNFTIYDLNPFDYVKVEGREVGAEVLASTVKRTDADDSLKLTGVIEAYAMDDSIRVLGVTYELDGATSYSPNKNFIVGDTVQIEDDDDSAPADGVADSVEVED